MPPEAYFVLIDAYLASYPDALVLVATDDHAYLQRMRRRYGGGGQGGSQGGSQGGKQGGKQGSSLQGRLVRRRESVVYRKDPFGEGRSRGGYLRGEDVLLDALLLAQCGSLLKKAPLPLTPAPAPTPTPNPAPSPAPNPNPGATSCSRVLAPWQSSRCGCGRSCRVCTSTCRPRTASPHRTYLLC